MANRTESHREQTLRCSMPVPHMRFPCRQRGSAIRFTSPPEATHAAYLHARPLLCYYFAVKKWDGLKYSCISGHSEVVPAFGSGGSVLRTLIV